jgi:hypothetical protein
MGTHGALSIRALHFSTSDLSRPCASRRPALPYALGGALDHLQALLLSFLPVSVGDRCSLVPTLSALLPGWAHARVEHSAVALEPFDFVLTIWVALALDEEPTQ